MGRLILVLVLLCTLVVTSVMLVSAQSTDGAAGEAGSGATLYLPAIQNSTQFAGQVTARPETALPAGNAALFLPAVQASAAPDAGLQLASTALMADVVRSSGAPAVPPDPATVCNRTIFADVVALDQVIVYNRLGATNPNGLIYALRRDVVAKDPAQPFGPGNVMLRPDKRPRPLVLRANVGDCLEIKFENLLGPATVPGQIPQPAPFIANNQFEEWPADRHVGIHVNNMQAVPVNGQRGILSDGSFVGQNPSSLVAPGESTTYKLYAEYENTFLLYNLGATVGSEGTGGTTGLGLFGAINVEPVTTDWYRSQLTRLEMDMAAAAWNADNTPAAGNVPRWDAAAVDPATGLATGYWAARTTPDGQPIINYNAVYPAGTGLGKDGTPIVNMLAPKPGYSGEVAHSDLNAIIAGPADHGYKIPTEAYGAGYWANENYPGGDDPFREFTVIFHDEAFAVQAFPQFTDPALEHTLHGVQDAFPINYGTGGIGAEIIANRLGLGPSANCVECKYEEFFLTAWAVGDPAMIVDVPANVNVDATGAVVPNPISATKALYPDDPSNVHHSYLNDRVKFRNLHAGPKEHHIFHLHAHQWQFDWSDQSSNYLDSQGIGPGAGFTYEIAYGGSGNRNKTVGDAIFHCHFYPHFAMGMWELWRNHDTFERGTVLDGSINGAPVDGSRALPDGEIVGGTPIPGLVPLPSLPMAPMPAAQFAGTITAWDNPDDAFDAPTSQIDLDGDSIPDILDETPLGEGIDLAALNTEQKAALNPGYPFFIPGLTGHRPPTPALDIVDVNGDGVLEDGGLPRHIITTGPNLDPLAGAVTHAQYQTPVDFNKELEDVGYGVVAEGGTMVEQVAMAFHELHWHDTFLPDGTAVDAAMPASRRLGEDATVGPDAADPHMTMRGFETNGLPPEPGAPYADPCRTDPNANGDIALVEKTRRYQGANIQMDVTLNKVGWHFPQQRFEALWEDVGDLLTGNKPPEPLVMRLNPTECAEFWHTNLVPNVYELDDYQVRTPTDIIGQHIHLVKFDVTSADGSANGWNYEDGTLSPQEVEERIQAIRNRTNAEADAAAAADSTAAPVRCEGDAVAGNGDVAGDNDPFNRGTPECPLAVAHPYFKDVPGVGDLAWGARTTVQRWYADPLLSQSWDRGLGTVFTHDHYGPSTHQQVGLYSTVLVEPMASTWRDPESGVLMGGILNPADGNLYMPGGTAPSAQGGEKLTASTTLAPRQDGGPTSWRADILIPQSQWVDLNGDGTLDDPSHREFFMEFADFQHAYHAGAAVAPHMADNGAGVQIPSYADFFNSVNPSYRQEPPAGNVADLYWFPEICPNGQPRPCPEAISADDPGTYVVNFRNEPVGLRVYDPATQSQAAGEAGDLASAFRSIPRPNMSTVSDPYAPLTGGVGNDDPYTPMLRVYQGDKVRIRVQTGAHEEEHNFTLYGLKWRQEDFVPNSGWRNSQFMGISEYFNLEMPAIPDINNSNNPSDYLYSIGAQTEDVWNGVWGIMRTYAKRRNDLLPLPNNNNNDKGLVIRNLAAFRNGSESICPVASNDRIYDVVAVRAADVLVEGALVYNNRTATVADPAGGIQGIGPLRDPTALMYVLREDLDPATGRMRAGAPVEPLVLRAVAGDCIIVNLENRLPADVSAVAGWDLPGFNALPPIVQKGQVSNGAVNGFVTFNANDVVPSNQVGLHAQLVAYDVARRAGINIGNNGITTVAPGGTTKYVWYAGDITLKRVSAPNQPVEYEMVARPVEFGVVNLMPADPIEGVSKGLAGALVVEPKGSSWQTDPGTRMSATVYDWWSDGPDADSNPDRSAFREFVTVLQNNINLRYAACDPAANPQVGELQCAVPSIASLGGGVAEDPQDAGQKAINYGADPLWYRLGIAPNTQFETAQLRGAIQFDVFSNSKVGGTDPQVPVFVVSPNAYFDIDGDGAADSLQFRQRVVEPGGHARGTVFTVNGHAWQREPYIANSDEIGSDWRTHDPLDLASPTTGHNMTSWWTGSQEGVGASSHFDIMPRKTGGTFGVLGDFLFGDYASFGRYQGLWGIIRHNFSAPMVAGEQYTAKRNVTLSVAAPGVLVNDRDLDEDSFTAVLVSSPATASAFVLSPNGSFAYRGTTIGADSFTYKACQIDGITCSAPVTVLIRVVNTAPAAGNDAYATLSGIPLTVAAPGLLGNDGDPNGDPIAITTVNGGAVAFGTPVALPSGGLLTINSDGLLAYSAASTFLGVDSFTYTVCETTTPELLCSAPATVTISLADQVAVTKAEFVKKTSTWTVTGTATPRTIPLQTFNVYLSRNNQLIGTATFNGVLPDGIGGTWSLVVKTKSGNVTPKTGDTIYVVSSRSGRSTPFTVTLK